MDDKWLDPGLSFSSNTHGSSTGMNNPFGHDFDVDGMNLDQSNDFKFDDAFDNIFGNDDHGGQGSLSYDQQPFHDHSGPQSFSAPAGSDNYQLSSAPVGLDGPSSYQNLSKDHNSLATPANGGIEQPRGSIESGKALVGKKGAYKRKKAASGPLKIEQRDSDDDYNSEAGENEEDEEVDAKTRRKSYAETRILTRWNTGQDQLLLLALRYECDLRSIELPWAAAYLHVNADGKPDAVFQHFSKVRKARIYYGIHVPPQTGKEVGKEKVEGPSVQHEEKDIRNFATLVYTKPGTDEDANGPPGTHEPIYTPRQIVQKPQLPYYGKPNWPLSLDEADKVMEDLATRGARWSTTVEHTVEVQDADYARSTKKRGRPTKATKVEQADEDDEAYVLKSTRKVQNTPTASQKKKAHTTPKSASKPKPKGVEKSKKASTPARKSRAKAVIGKTPMGLLSEEVEAVHFKSPAETPSRKAAAATFKKSTATKKKGKTAKANSPPTPSSEETSTKAHTKLSAGRYSRDEKHFRIEPSETPAETMSKLPFEDFQLGRNPGRQDLGSQATANGTPGQSMHHQGGQSFGPQSAMPNMPSMPDQSMQYQGGQGFGPQPIMANGSGLPMQKQGNSGYNGGYNQQMASVPMYHHGQHMAAQTPQQQWQMQAGQSSVMNNNINMVAQTPQQQLQMQGGQNSMMNDTNTMAYSAEDQRVMRLLHSMLKQPGILQQLNESSEFPGFGLNTGPMVREPLANYEAEMADYIHSSGPSATESLQQSRSFDSTTLPSSISTNNVDSKPQDLEQDTTEPMTGVMEEELNETDFALFLHNDEF